MLSLSRGDWIRTSDHTPQTIMIIALTMLIIYSLPTCFFLLVDLLVDLSPLG